MRNCRISYRAERADEAIKKSFWRDEYHVVIADLDLPDSAGTSFVKGLRAAAPNVPVVVVAGSDTDVLESGLDVIHAGAQDLFSRQSLDSDAIYRGVTFAIARARQSSEVSSPGYYPGEIKDQFLSQFSHELR